MEHLLVDSNSAIHVAVKAAFRELYNLLLSGSIVIFGDLTW